MDAVQGAHLYGRRLVLEWAAEDGGLDELRAKTAAKFRGDDTRGLQAGGGFGDEEMEEAEEAAEAEAAAPAAKRRKRRNKN